MQLESAVPGRNVFYADPYKVGDGAPTAGIKRDTSLFANQLTGDTVTFTAQQRGLWLRFVEVDPATDEVLSFRAMIAVQDSVSPPDTVNENDILADFNGSFENDLTFWRFYEVPNSIGSIAEIITDDVIHGAKAVKITYVAPDNNLADRSLDNWDSNMPLEPGARYICKFWAKSDSPDTGKVTVTYGFFGQSRNVISEAGAWFSVTNAYKEYEFNFTAPEGTISGWLAFRWKDQVNDTFMPGVVYFDHIQLLIEDKPVGFNDIELDNPDQSGQILNFPNPFSTATTIHYVLQENSEVQLNIYTVYGQKIAGLVNQKMNAGIHEVTWNVTDLAEGIYLVGLKTKSGFVTRKMILSK
jgi:hypothetical protein